MGATLLLGVGGKRPAENRLLQIGLIFFDFKEIMPAIVLDLLAQIPLAEHRVAGDHAACKHNRLEQRQSRLVLVGFAVDFRLGECKTRPLVEQRQQVNRSANVPHSDLPSMATGCNEASRAGSSSASNWLTHGRRASSNTYGASFINSLRNAPSLAGVRVNPSKYQNSGGWA